VSTTAAGLVTETWVTEEIRLTETLTAVLNVRTVLQEEDEGDGVGVHVVVELPAPGGYPHVIAPALCFRGRVRVCGELVGGAWGRQRATPRQAGMYRYRDTWKDGGDLDARSWPTHAQAREGGLAVGRGEVMLLVRALRARAEAHARVGS
jgi:hypothetical protein